MIHIAKVSRDGHLAVFGKRTMELFQERVSNHRNEQLQFVVSVMQVYVGLIYDLSRVILS